MCGIIGYVGDKEAAPILLESLKKMEYRGYDSAGIGTLHGSSIYVKKDAGRVDDIHRRLNILDLPGCTGIGHTRWATHGLPNETNAHPHADCEQRIVLVHNGIIENHTELREQLLEGGHEFVSQTDTEVLAHLFEEHYDGDLPEAVRKGLKRVEGSYAIAVIHADHPGTLVAARHENPLVVGVSATGEVVLASDVTPLLEFTKDFTFLEDGDVVVGVVSAPAIAHRWWAARGLGAFRNGDPIRVSAVAELADAQLSYNSQTTCEEAGLGPQALALARACRRIRGYGDFWSHCLVAEGAVDVAVEPTAAVWDLAPLKIIVEEAGGCFTDLSGAGHIDGGNALTSNGLVHDQALEILST